MPLGVRLFRFTSNILPGPADGNGGKGCFSCKWPWFDSGIFCSGADDREFFGRNPVAGCLFTLVGCFFDIH